MVNLSKIRLSPPSFNEEQNYAPITVSDAWIHMIDTSAIPTNNQNLLNYGKPRPIIYASEGTVGKELANVA
jgi:hypothetical protein